MVKNPEHSRYDPMRGGNRLQDVQISGSSMKSHDLIESCVRASLTSSMTSVTELQFTFADDHEATLFRKGIFKDGHTVTFAHWRGRIRGGGRLKASRGGPQVEVIAPSLFVEKLRDQTGGKNWGRQNVTYWFRRQCEAIGMRHHIQSDLGFQDIVREKPEGDREESTWDIMTAVAEEAGAWIFEHSSRLIVGKPAWLPRRSDRSRNEISLYWKSWDDCSAGLMGLPQFTPGPAKDQELTVEVTGSDSNRHCPGDSLTLTGRLNGGVPSLNANGLWVVRDVKIPLTRSQATTLTCIRPVKGAL